jgi:hypothetical protein
MILGAIEDKKEFVPENTELQDMKKRIDELEKQVSYLKYGLIFIAIYYIYNQLKK